MHVSDQRISVAYSEQIIPEAFRGLSRPMRKIFLSALFSNIKIVLDQQFPLGLHVRNISYFD